MVCEVQLWNQLDISSSWEVNSSSGFILKSFLIACFKTFIMFAKTILALNSNFECCVFSKLSKNYLSQGRHRNRPSTTMVVLGLLVVLGLMVVLGLFACTGPPFAVKHEFPPQTCKKPSNHLFWHGGPSPSWWHWASWWYWASWWFLTCLGWKFLFYCERRPKTSK